jgi:hypothetical protein
VCFPSCVLPSMLEGSTQQQQWVCAVCCAVRKANLAAPPHNTAPTAAGCLLLLLMGMRPTWLSQQKKVGVWVHAVLCAGFGVSWRHDPAVAEGVWLGSFDVLPCNNAPRPRSPLLLLAASWY